MNTTNPPAAQTRHSLASQIRVGLVVLILLSLVPTAGVLIMLSFRSQLEQVHTVQRERSRAAAKEIDAYLDDIQRKLNYLGRVRGLTDLPQETQLLLLDALTRHNDAYEAVAIGQPDGTIIASVSPYGALPWRSLRDVPVFQQTLVRQEDGVSVVERDTANNLLLVNFAIPVRDAQDAVAGVLIAQVNLKFLSFVVTETQVGETGYVYVVDQRGVPIAAQSRTTDAALLVAPSLEPALQRRIADGLSAQDAYSGLYGTEVLGAFAPVPTANWTVVVELPTAEVYAPIRQLLTVMGIALVASILVASAASIIAARHILIPLERLTEAAARISTGDLSTRIALASRNELGLLASTFNTMSDQLQRLFAQLRESEQRFRAIFDQTFQFTGLLTLDGTLLEVNQTALQFRGQRAEDVIGKPFWDTLWWPDDPAGQERLRVAVRAASQGLFVRYEAEIYDRQHQRATIDFSLKPVHDPDGRVVLLIPEGRDITDRKRAEEATRQLVHEQAIRSQAELEQQRFAFLASASATLATSLDYETTLQSIAQLAVPYLAEYCIIDLIEPQGEIRRVALAHRDADKQTLVQQLGSYPPQVSGAEGVSRVLQAGEPQLIGDVSPALLEQIAQDERHLALLQALRPCSLMIMPLTVRTTIIGAFTLATAESGRRYGHDDLALAQEIAGRAALAIDNARLYHEAQEAVRVRDQFLSIAAHELRTPLTALLGNAQLLERRATRDTNIGERNQNLARVVSGQANRLNKMIVTLLDITRLERNQLQLEYETLDLAALLHRLVDEMQASLRTHTMRVSVVVEPVMLDGDALRLEQVFQNLIHNAIKYSPAGGSIHIDLTLSNDSVCVSVRDQGIGIPASSLPHLFQRFYRAANVDNHSISGMGIGLYVVKEIVGLHGGTVTATSIENHGSTFTVTLPLAAETSALLQARLLEHALSTASDHAAAAPLASSAS